MYKNHGKNINNNIRKVIKIKTKWIIVNMLKEDLQQLQINLRL